MSPMSTSTRLPIPPANSVDRSGSAGMTRTTSSPAPTRIPAFSHKPRFGEALFFQIMILHSRRGIETPGPYAHHRPGRNTGADRAGARVDGGVRGHAGLRALLPEFRRGDA